MESEQIQIIEVNRNTRREEERNLVRNIFYESLNNRGANFFVNELENCFSRIEAKSRGAHGLTLDGKSSFQIAYSSVDAKDNVQTIADNYGVDPQTINRLKNDLIASIAFISVEVLDSNMPITLTKNQYERMVKIKDQYYESIDLISRIERPEVQNLLEQIPHVNFILKEYASKLSLKDIFLDLKLEVNESRIGDINKEIRAFILGITDNPRGIRKTASDVLFKAWVENHYLSFMNHKDIESFEMISKQINNGDKSVEDFRKYINLLNIHKKSLRFSLKQAISCFLQGYKKNELPLVLGVSNSYTPSHNSTVVASAFSLVEKILSHQIKDKSDLTRLSGINIDESIRLVLKKFQSIK